MEDSLNKTLTEKLGESSETKYVFRAPARINIIGEHVDYLGGFVLPSAINFYMYVVVRKNTSNLFRIYSKQFDRLVESNNFEYNRKEEWVNYVLGVLKEYSNMDYKISGFDMVIDGNIPTGAGLSSSAALEVVVAYAISELFGFGIPRKEIALIGQRAENNFVGVNCGIMDQFIIANGKENSCLFLKTDTLEFSYIPIDMEDVGFYLVNSEVKHSLKDSEYNTRRKECDEALKKIQRKNTEIRYLYELDAKSDLEKYELTNNEKKRVEHVLGEKERTISLKNAIHSKDFTKLGNTLFETHFSLSQLYEVSCKETDFIVETLKDLNVLGARMMGGGFGGCVLVLDRKINFPKIQNEVRTIYKNKMNILPSIYNFEICNGVEQI